ncbi:hypothetical protein C8J55DRAFT_92072 [Lentinula edodes]|uniref:Uncharacterized protein n=1 Tax=Lentinula lateritia TaxID=40482 RepID=A0A9W9A9H8_9AGAR|nr:hypothetical protein C8J55DRAFT_92072 [Lentinula edodes]
MLFLNRIFRSPSSSLSPTLYYPLHFLSLFTLALLINSVITFAEAAPVPPGISQQSEQFEAPKKNNLLPSGFEKCTLSATSGFLFRVGSYDSTRKKTTRSGHGVLVLCIGKKNCFGYTTTTTGGGGGTSAAGTQHSNGLVIYTTTQQRTDTSAIRSDRYQLLPNITPNCEKFNTWSEKNYEKTLVDFLMSIVDLRNALTHSDATVTIDSQVSYILAILDYLCSKGMITAYSKPQIKKVLEQSQSPKPLSGASRLSWGFRGSNSKQPWLENWRLLAEVKLPEKTSPLLCFGVDHCFGLKSDNTVRDIKPALKSFKGKETQYVNTRNLFPLGSATLYPSFNLQSFETHLQTSSTTSFFVRLIGHSHSPVRFQDISSEEIESETKLKKLDGEDMETFYFRVLLGYMAAKEIIGNYNKDTYGEIMKALELVRAGKMKAAGAEEPGDDSSASLLSSGGGLAQQEQEAVVAAPVHNSPGTNSQGVGAANYPQRISVSSLLNPHVNSSPNH